MHFLVVGSAGGPFRERLMSKFIGFTTKKNTAEATRMNDMNVLIKCPYANLLPFITNESPEKSGSLAIAPMSGVSISDTKAVTIVPNAAPITTPTARSTTLPRSKNCLNSFNINKFVQ